MVYKMQCNLSELAVDALRGVPGADAAFDNMARWQKGFFSRLYKKLVSGAVDCISWDNGRGNVYCLTRSVKVPGSVQRTCFWSRDGELIPLSDQTYSSFDDMRRDYLPDGVTIRTEVL